MKVINFIGYLIVICVLGFVALFIQGLAKNRRTIPVSDELTKQIIGESVPVMIELARLTVTGLNTHWFTHTFERPRRKVKQ